MGFGEGLDDTGPRSRHIAAVVPSASRADDASLAVLVSESAQGRCSVRVRLFRPAQVGNRVSLQAVGAALHQDEFRFLRIDTGFHLLPRPPEFSVICARSHGDIQFCSLRPAFAGFMRMTRSRVQVPSVLVDIGKDQVGVILKSVENAITMMRVDIDVGDAPQSVLPAQVLSRDSAIIENTESGSAITRRVMKSGNWNKCALVVAMHDFVNSAQDCADNSRSRVVDSFDGGRITIIKVALADSRQARHLVNVVSGMEQGELINQSRTRMTVVYAVAQSGLVELIVEDVMAIGAERVRIAKTIGCDLISLVNQHALTHIQRPNSCLCRSIPDNARF